MSENRLKFAQKVQQDAEVMKTLKSHYKQHSQIIQEELNLRNMQRYNSVKIFEKQLNLKKLQIMEEKKKQATMEYQKKIIMESQKNQQFIRMFSQLEQKEQELLRNL